MREEGLAISHQPSAISKDGICDRRDLGATSSPNSRFDAQDIFSARLVSLRLIKPWHPAREKAYDIDPN